MEILADKYELLETAGAGGSGIVYKGWNRDLKCFVAVKEFHEINLIQQREIEMLKKLRHPALPGVMDYVEENGKQYLIMEYIEGITLQEYVEKNGSICETEAVGLALELAQVLKYFHNRSEPVLYRDIKPSNIMIEGKSTEHTSGEPSFSIRLIDLGSACLKHQEKKEEYICAGTGGYCAPEQFGEQAWEAVDERSDIYGLGTVLHFMLTGNDPSKPPYTLEPLRCYNGALAGELEKLVARATAADKKKRYGRVEELENSLRNYTRKDKAVKRAAALIETGYHILLFLLLGSFLYSCQKLEDCGENILKERIAVIAVVIILLCFFADRVKRNRRKAGRVRQIKNVYLTAKCGRGLIAVLGIACAAFLLHSPRLVLAEEGELLPVVVRNSEGQKLLIRYDAVYSVEDSMRLELPAETFIAGEEYVLTLECVNSETKEKMSRTFYLERQP